MKLNLITEKGLSGSRHTIRDAGKALGDLIEFIYNLGRSEETIALDRYLSSPTPKGWNQIKWIIDSASQKASRTKEPTLQDRIKKWAELKTLTSPVITAALYDIDPKFTKGTPLQKIALSQQIRDKMKLALGPQGYVASLANANSIPPSRLKTMMKDTAKSGTSLAKAAKRDIPTVKPVDHF